MLSVIVPVLNEERLLRDRQDYFRDLARHSELIFVDGGSRDRTRAILAGIARVIEAPQGRARQMNAGAKAAGHPVLLFLHADNSVERPALELIERTAAARDLAGGCLRQVINESGWIYSWIAWTGNVRARLTKIYYGDQGIFVRKDIFERLGGYPAVEIGEDVAFSRKLKGCGRVKMLDVPITCSARRWLRQGVVRTTVINTRVKLGLMLGRDHRQLSHVYRDVR